MLLSWLVATLAYSPECLLKDQLGIVAFFPSHYAYLLLNSPCAASQPGTELWFPCIGWSWSHEGQGPLCSYKSPASCAVLEGPCAFKWVCAHQWAALHGLGKWNWDEGLAQAEMISPTHRELTGRCFVIAKQTWCLSR